MKHIIAWSGTGAAAIALSLLVSCASGSLPSAQRKLASAEWSYHAQPVAISGAAVKGMQGGAKAWIVPASFKSPGRAPLMSRLSSIAVADTVSAASAVATPPVPHPLADHAQCLSCHAVGTGSKPAPDNHKDRGIDVCLYCHVPQEGAAAIPPLPAKPSASFCLGCHGPFSAIAEKSADYVSPEGEKANPHVFVPHSSTKIVSCTECHEPHELPPSASTIIAKPDIQYCWSCHHEEDFTPCSKCHK